MLVELKRHPKHTGIVIARTPPDLAHTMGRFGPARWNKDLGAYLLDDDQVENLGTFLRVNGGHRVLDERDAEPAGKGVALGPLPECAACGQPARREAALTLRVCPGCGAPWTVAQLPSADVVARAVTRCPSCGRDQRGRFRFCSECGADMPAPAPPGRPLIPERPRHPLDDPVAFGDVLAGADPDGQLPLDPQETTP